MCSFLTLALLTSCVHNYQIQLQLALQLSSIKVLRLLLQSHRARLILHPVPSLLDLSSIVWLFPFSFASLTPFSVFFVFTYLAENFLCTPVFIPLPSCISLA